MDRPTAVSAGRSFVGAAPVVPSRFGWHLGRFCILPVIALLLACPRCPSQERRKVIIDQDEAGPAGTDLGSTLLLIQSPQTEVLGITVVTGDMWLKEEVAHTLRMLELIGRTDIPVVPGAEYPLVRTKEETELWEQHLGAAIWASRVPRRLDPEDISPRGSGGRTEGRKPQGQTGSGGRCAFPGAHGAAVPESSDDLCRRPDDQLGLGNFYRS